MTASLNTLLATHAAQIKDHAGISQLDIWIAQRRLDGPLVNAVHITELIDFVESTEMNSEGVWAAVEYVVRKLGVNSRELASVIDRKIATPALNSTLRPFDMYSAWKAVCELGGVFTPRVLKERAEMLRINAGPHWLDLAILAYNSDEQGLGEAVSSLANEERISSFDLENRYEDISAALGSVDAATMLRRVSVTVQNALFVSDLWTWAKEELHIALTPQIPIAQASHRRSTLKDDSIVNRIRMSPLVKRPVFNHSNAAHA
jgi:hypothetical protein